MKPSMVVLSMMILGSLIVAPVPSFAADMLPPGLTAEAIASAKTPEQHRAIADAYAKEADELRAQALAHRHMDSSYNEAPYRSSKLGLPRHCRALTLAYEAAAKDADALAKAHREMADAEARKTK